MIPYGLQFYLHFVYGYDVVIEIFSHKVIYHGYYLVMFTIRPAWVLVPDLH
jgi:hypothetical protein